MAYGLYKYYTNKEPDMAKSHDAKKNVKKAPQKTPKEKKQAKLEKKQKKSLIGSDK